MCDGGLLIVSTAVMMAGGNDGLPSRWVRSLAKLVGMIILDNTGRSVLLCEGGHIINSNSADATYPIIPWPGWGLGYGIKKISHSLVKGWQETHMPS